MFFFYSKQLWFTNFGLLWYMLLHTTYYLIAVLKFDVALKHVYIYICKFHSH